MALYKLVDFCQDTYQEIPAAAQGLGGSLRIDRKQLKYFSLSSNLSSGVINLI